MMTNILQLTTYYKPHISGITTNTHRLNKYLVQKGYTVTVLTSQHEKHLKKQGVIHGVNIVRNPVAFYIYKTGFQPALFFRLLKYIHHADCVFIHWPYAESVIASLACLLLRKRLILSYHAHAPDLTNASPLTLLFFKKCIEVFLHITSACADIITTSTLDYIKDHHILSKHTHKIRRIRPIVSLYPRKQTSKLPALEGFNGYTIGFVGRFCKQKGIYTLINTIPLLREMLKKDFRIAIAGPINTVGETHYEELNTYLIQNKKHIIILGTLSDTELAAFYSYIDCLVLPSVNSCESFGIVQLEAMLRGIPVVASDLPGVRVPVSKSGFGKVFTPNDKYKLANAIVHVLQTTYSSSHIKNVQKHFNQSVALRKYRALIDTLVRVS